MVMRQHIVFLVIKIAIPAVVLAHQIVILALMVGN